LLENGDDLAVGKAGGLHAELSVCQVEKSISDRALFWGDYRKSARQIAHRKRLPSGRIASQR